MSDDAPHPSCDFIASVQPIVLVGGKSRRFGRDKLREPLEDTGTVLVQRPIETLRAVFGHCVKLVGECDPAVVRLADGVIPDDHPDVGPIGGIISALKHGPGPIFVLAGDMPHVSSEDVRRILGAAEHATSALAALATTDRVHACAGVYFPAALATLSVQLQRGSFRLATALPHRAVISVPWSPRSATNVNSASDLEDRGRSNGD